MKKILTFLFLLLPLTAGAYERIISLKPNLTEILFALDLGDKVIGVTEYCKYPPEAQKITKIGGYSTPNLEKILALRPDLVVLIPESTSPRLEEAVRRAGIETLVVKTSTLSDIEKAIQTIADKTGRTASGKKLLAGMKNQFTNLQKKISGAPQKAVWIIQRTPLIVAGNSTFFGDLMIKAGLKNIADTSPLPYPHFSLETLVEKKPDVIIDMDPTPHHDSWLRYRSLPAVERQKVFYVSPEPFVPGPRLPQALELVIEKVYAR